jgi:hypothetical protein
MAFARTAPAHQTSGVQRPFPWLPLLVLGSVALVFAAMVAEIVLRVGELRESNLVELQCAGAGALLQGQKGLFRLDEFSGFSMRPNLCVRLKSPEYDQVLRTNDRGFVGPSVTTPKPQDEFRIVVLGDSYTAGGQAPYEQNYTAVLQDFLRASGYSYVRVINLGVGGCGTFCQAGLLKEHISWTQPDLVVVSVFVGNNIFENVLSVAGGYRDAPEHPKGVTWGPAAAALVDQSGAWFPRNGLPPTDVPPAWDPSQPLPEAVGNAPPGTPPYSQPAASSAPAGSLTGLRSIARGFWDGARLHSRLLAAAFGEPVDLSVTTAPGAAPPSKELKRLNVTSFEWTILRDPPRTYWLDVAWPLFERYLSDIQATAAASGARVVVMAIPQMGQFDEATRARTMADFRFREDEVDWQRPQRELHARADALGIPVLDLLAVFQSRADHAQLYLRQDTHFAALGHQVAGVELGAFLERARLIDR